MKNPLIPSVVVWVLFLAAYSPCLAAAKDQCAICHAGIDKKNSSVVAAYAQDIHFQKGIGCAGCHGGDATKSDEEGMDPEKGFIGVPAPADIPRVCGRCHSDANYMRRFNPALPIDQEEKYHTSRHGVLLKKGDRKVATCVSCHGVHGILAPENTGSPVYTLNVPATCGKCHSDSKYMASYGIPTTQHADYMQSVHGVALTDKKAKGAPVCNDCHGNHGAGPPGVDDVAAVCVTCHAFNGELFNQSPHRDAFRTAGLSQCAACHDHHRIVHPTDDMLGVNEGAICVKCHRAGEAGYGEARDMKRLLDSLIAGQTRAKTALARAEALDMDVTDGEAAVEVIRENVIEARTAIHASTVEHLRKVAQKGLDAENVAVNLANAAVYEYKFRRSGFGVATLIITGLAVLLWLKIRQIERRQRATKP